MEGNRDEKMTVNYLDSVISSQDVSKKILHSSIGAGFLYLSARVFGHSIICGSSICQENGVSASWEQGGVFLKVHLYYDSYNFPMLMLMILQMIR